MVKKEKKLIQYINLKLAMLGVDCVGEKKELEFNDLARSLLFSLQEKDRLLKDYLCPPDQRIQDFISDYFKEEGVEPRDKNTHPHICFGSSRTCSGFVVADEWR